MTGLVGAELLKLRRRWASYVVLGVLLVLMTLIYLLIGFTSGRAGGRAAGLVLQFPDAYGVINQFVFGLGSLLAVSYGAAVGGADWNWGVMRVIVARGEGRSRYVLAKYLGVALFCVLGVIVAYTAGIVLTYGSAALAGMQPGSPFAGDGVDTLIRSVVSGGYVLLERMAIGFAVAMVLRSQVAGVVVGIVLYLGEGLLSTIMTVMNTRGLLSGQQLEPQWFQYLPFSIGNSVLNGAARTVSSDVSDLLLRPVPLATALVVTGIYLVAALVIAMLVTERAEIA